MSKNFTIADVHIFWSNS